MHTLFTLYYTTGINPFMNIDTKYRSHTLMSILKSGLAFTFLMFFISMPAYSKQDKGEKKKKRSVEMVTQIEPDPICKKAKPDRHPKSHEMPYVGYNASGRGGRQLEGYDISHYQGNIDWAAFSSDPQCGFVYIKATEANSIVDNTYERNINEARRHGVKVGTYHFFRANNSARDQFAIFKSVFDPHKQDLLPMVDVETMPKGMAKSKFDDCLLEFIQLIEHEYGVKPIIYTGKNFYNKYFFGTRFTTSYKFWIAAYADEQPVLNNNDDYLIWQYSAKGKAHGVKGYIDRNKFVGRHGLNEIRYK